MDEKRKSEKAPVLAKNRQRLKISKMLEKVNMFDDSQSSTKGMDENHTEMFEHFWWTGQSYNEGEKKRKRKFQT